MDTYELRKILYHMPVNGDVCAKDLLPEKKPLDVKAYIINTDNSDEPGEHWVALYFRGNQAIFFDSYGMSPEEDYILPFIKRNSRSWIQNTEPLQSPWSKNCGRWCIYIIHQLEKGLDLKKAIHGELYGTGEDLYQNDRDIDRWFCANYVKVIDAQSTPNFLFKHRIQVCKCLRNTHCLSKKYPMYLML
ncbi:MAG: hypothetical protein JAY75_02135 [Candidatus Thiodiazotropha taylori]|nr:hypothetical protein [Candidatus Thiodiazotropha taylori]MCW4307005.1 hypothetical protein [Candidatus Thiodiazotropha endolucinida]